MVVATSVVRLNDAPHAFPSFPFNAAMMQNLSSTAKSRQREHEERAAREQADAEKATKVGAPAREIELRHGLQQTPDDPAKQRPACHAKGGSRSEGGTHRFQALLCIEFVLK